MNENNKSKVKNALWENCGAGASPSACLSPWDITFTLHIVIWSIIDTELLALSCNFKISAVVYLQHPRLAVTASMFQ